MSSVSLPAPNVAFITNSFNYVLTEMSHLTPEKLQLLANFFQLQASKYSNSLLVTRVVALGSLASGVTLAVTALSVQNHNARAAFFIGGAVLGSIGVIVGLSQFIIMAQQN